jgi:hypothetical protein
MAHGISRARLMQMADELRRQRPRNGIISRRKSTAMPSSDSAPELSDEHMDDIPPPPARFGMYVERELQARVRAAYERGLLHGSRHDIALFLTGVVLGWLLNLWMTR